MFITPDEVMASTPYTGVTVDLVRQAQWVIEAYVGRVESDVDSPRDKSMLARAVAFQTVYMLDNPDITFNQIKTASVSSGGQMTTFNDDYSPFLSPLAVKACSHLSWKRSRSVAVGRMFQHKWLDSPIERWVRD